jgi:hypothetical protein
MAGTPPTAQQQQGWSPTQQNPNQPTSTQNPYGNTGSNYQQPSYVDTSQFSPNATIQQILAGFAPQAQSSENNLNQTLADFGINGGQAVGAMTQLQSQLGASLAPSLANAIMGSQGMQLQGGEFNSGAYNNQQQDIWNAISGIIGGGQSAGNTNANNYGQTITTQQNPFASIFSGLTGAAGAAGGLGWDPFASSTSGGGTGVGQTNAPTTPTG